MITRVTRIVLISAAAGCLGLLSYAADLSSGQNFLWAVGFGLWVVSPFVFLLHATRRFEGNRTRDVVLLLVSLATALFAAFVYYDAFFVSMDAQSALVFIFVPLWQWVGAAASVAAMDGWAWWRRRRPGGASGTG